MQRSAGGIGLRLGFLAIPLVLPIMSSGASDHPYSGRDSDGTGVEVISRALPSELPHDMDLMGFDYLFDVLFLIGEDGTTVEAWPGPPKVTRSKDPVANFAIEMVKQWTFHPAIVEGDTVSAVVIVPVTLVPKGETPEADRQQPGLALTPVDLYPSTVRAHRVDWDRVMANGARTDTIPVVLKSTVWPSTVGHKIKRRTTVDVGVNLFLSEKPVSVWVMGPLKAKNLGTEVRKSALKWKWKPATIDGVPVRSRTVIPIEFKLGDESGHR